MHNNAAIILAGGEGRRLLSLTRQLTGDDRPKPVSSAVWDDVGDPGRAIAARARWTLDVVTA